MFSASGDCEFFVDWGDGEGDLFNNCGTYSHKYGSNDVYEIKITGKLTNLRIYNTDQVEWIRIDSFGPVGLGESAFRGINNLVLSEVDIPNALLLHSTNKMF